MTEKIKTFWCEKCCKKTFLTEDACNLKVERSELQKKIPFLDIEKNKKNRPVYLQRKNLYKCQKCGYLLKEINDEKK